MTVGYVRDLGEIGTVDGIRHPLTVNVRRSGAAWNLTGYTAAALVVWDLRTKATVAVNGSAAVSVAADGTVTYDPGASDPIVASSGEFEGRFMLTPAAGDPEPSDLFRFSIGAGPTT